MGSLRLRVRSERTRSFHTSDSVLSRGRPSSRSGDIRRAHRRWDAFEVASGGRRRRSLGGASSPEEWPSVVRVWIRTGGDGSTITTGDSVEEGLATRGGGRRRHVTRRCVEGGGVHCPVSVRFAERTGLRDASRVPVTRGEKRRPSAPRPVKSLSSCPTERAGQRKACLRGSVRDALGPGTHITPCHFITHVGKRI